MSTCPKVKAKYGLDGDVINLANNAHGFTRFNWSHRWRGMVDD